MYMCMTNRWTIYVRIPIPKLETSDGRIVTDQNDILKESENFYKDLYSNKDDPLAEINLTEYLKNVNLPKLTDNESNQLEGYITLSELTKALSNIKKTIKVQERMAFQVNFLKFFGKNMYFCYAVSKL